MTETIVIYQRKRLVTKTGKTRLVWSAKVNDRELIALTKKMLSTLVQEQLAFPVLFEELLIGV
jgi:hypothetical protein